MDYNINDEEYLKHQHYYWPSHATCFHTTFKSYTDCIFTCAEEIEEFVQKVGGEKTNG